MYGNKMEPHIICDPIHGIMELNKSSYKAVKSIIDDPLFQRVLKILILLLLKQY